MITPNKIKRSQAKHILELIEQMTRADVMARLGPTTSLEFGDYYTMKLEKMDELLEYVYGTSSLVKLGMRWKLLKRSGKVRHGKSKKNKKTTG